MNTTKLFMLCLGIGALIVGCNGSKEQSTPTPEKQDTSTAQADEGGKRPAGTQATSTLCIDHTVTATDFQAALQSVQLDVVTANCPPLSLNHAFLPALGGFDDTNTSTEIDNAILAFYQPNSYTFQDVNFKYYTTSDGNDSLQINIRFVQNPSTADLSHVVSFNTSSLLEQLDAATGGNCSSRDVKYVIVHIDFPDNGAQKKRKGRLHYQSVNDKGIGSQDD